LSRYASLCWGQRYIWLKHYQLPPAERHDLNFTISIGPAPGSTIESIRRALDLLVRRHEGLRTTFHPDENGPVQRVHAPRPVPIVRYDTDDYPKASLTRLVNDFTAAPFALETEPPFRACIVSTGSVPVRVVLVGHHTAMDDWSMERIKRDADELHESIMARRTAALRPVRHHPVDLARYEASDEAARAHQRSRGHWDQALSRIPADMYGARRPAAGDDPAAGPAGLSASLSSPAALSGLRDLATRYGVWPSTVCTAAFTALLAAYTRCPAVYYRNYVSNRDGPRYPEVVTCMFQPVLIDIDCAGDPSFAEVVRRTAHRSAQSLSNSSCAYDEIMEDISRRSSERGMALRLGTVFNHLLYPDKVRGGKRAIFNWNPVPRSWLCLDDDCYLRVSEWSDCVVATLDVRSSIMTAGDAERFLRGFESLLTAGAEESETLSISEIGRRAGFSDPDAAGASNSGVRGNIVTVGGTTVDLARVAECIRAYPGVRAARVFQEAGGDGGLTAYVAGAGPRPSPGALRAHVLGRMYDSDRVCCPRRFVICAEAPVDADTASAWAAQPVVMAGSGRDVPAIPPETEAARHFCEAVLAVNRLDRVSMAQSYVMAGGRVMNIPRIQQIMRAHGLAGPSLYEIASARPLTAIAAMYLPAADPDNQLQAF
jgi:hypothetical protein